MLMSSPRLFCPAFRLGTHPDGIRTSSQSSSRKRKRSEVDLGEARGEYQQAISVRAGKDQPQTQGSLQRQGGLGKDGFVEKAAIMEDSYPSEDESGTSEATSPSLTSPSLSWRQPLPRRRLVSGPPRSDGPRQQHLAVVAAILHRCLLQGEYVRASRAWALLLRSEMNGRPIDVRDQGRWGIGAEILHQKSLSQRGGLLREDQGSALQEYDEMSTTNTSSRDNQYSRPSQDYYERLIVQYPFRKRYRNAIGPLEFYPALFGLRMFSEQQIHEDLLRSFQENKPHDQDNMRDDTSSGSGSISPENRNSEFLRLKNLLESSVTRAKETANQLDELLSSPPYSDDSKLQNLRSMIDLWIGDLLTSPYFKRAPVTDNSRDS